MHPLNGAPPVPYLPVRVTRGAWSHIGSLMLFLAVVPRSTAGPLFPSHYVFLWDDLANPVFEDVVLAGFKNM